MRRVFTGASGGRKGYSGGFGTGGITPVDFLGVVANQAAMLLLVGDKGDWCIRSDLNTVWIVINTPSSLIGNWQQLAYPVDPSKVLSDVADPTPGYLDAKVDNETLLVDPLRHFQMLRSIAIPVLSLFDNTAALPVGPGVGDRYAALVTANGWLIGGIYQWNGAAWVVIKAANDCTVIITYTGVVGAWLYYQNEWTVLFCGFSDEINRLTAKAVPTTADLLLIEDAADFERKKKITIASLPAAAPAAHAVSHNAGGGDVMAIDAAAATGSLRTIGIGALQACAGNDARLSDARTPTAHAASHNLGGADIVTTIPRYVFFADQVLTPNNADWAVNSAAGMSADSLNNALLNRQFDDTTEEGIGLFIEIPAGAVNMTFYFRSRAQTAPGAATTVLPRLYRRQIADNTVVGSWSAAFAFAQLDIPTNTRFQYDSETVTLAALGLTAGNVVQLELTRNPADGLVGDWNLLELRIYFG